MSIANVNNLNPNGNAEITIGTAADETTGARFGIYKNPLNTDLDFTTTFFGHDAALSAGGNNFSNGVAIGAQASKNATGTACVFIGSAAGINAQANESVGIGRSAGGSTGSKGTFVGDLAGTSTTAEWNTCIGYRAGSRLTTGQKNTLIGTYAGSTGDTDTGSLITGSNNIVLQSGGLGEWDLGSDVSNTVVLGSSTQTAIYAGVNTITALSDKRDKKDVKEISAGLDFIKDLKPVNFIWDERKEEGKRDIKDCGFLAQDLKETEEKHGVADHLRLVDDKNPEKLLATYGRLLPVMVKAIQELSAEVEKLKA